MFNLLLMVLSTAGMLGVGWFVWKKLQEQDSSAADSSNDTHSDDNTDTTEPS